MNTTKAVKVSLLPDHVPGEAFAKASRFREDSFDCLIARGDELFDLTDALLCADGPVRAPVDLTLVAEHRRGHGAMYDALNCGNVDVPRLRQVLAGLPMPQAADGRLVLAVDVSNWLRPAAPTSAERLFGHVYGRSGRSSDQFVPGWPYSFVAALESGRTSWCQFLAAVRLGPDDDVAEVTAVQVRRVVVDLIEMGRWHVGDRDILVVFDAGYDAPRMAHLLRGLPWRSSGASVVEDDQGRPVVEDHPEALLGQHGEAFKVDGALISVLLRRQDTGSGTWALTSRQEIHHDDFERTGELLSWLATKAGDSHRGADGSIGLGWTRFCEEGQPEPLVARDSAVIWPS